MSNNCRRVAYTLNATKLQIDARSAPTSPQSSATTGTNRDRLPSILVSCTHALPTPNHAHTPHKMLCAPPPLLPTSSTACKRPLDQRGDDATPRCSAATRPRRNSVDRAQALRHRLEALGAPPLGEQLGAGSSAVVFALRDQPSMVVKVMVEAVPGAAFAGVQDVEMRIARVLGAHARVLAPHALQQYGPYPCLTLMRCERSLAQLLHEQRAAPGGWKPLPVERRLKYMRHLLEALQFCARHNVVHRDVKPHNLLIDAAGGLRLADFGLAHQVTDDEARNDGRHLSDYRVVSLWYCALEVLFANENAVGFDYGFAADVWAAGCVYAELLQSHALFGGTDSTDMVRRICAEVGAPAAEMWPHGAQAVWALLHKRPPQPDVPLARLVDAGALPSELSVLLRLLQPEPCCRASASEALQHLLKMPLPTKLSASTVNA